VAGIVAAKEGSGTGYTVAGIAAAVGDIAVDTAGMVDILDTAAAYKSDIVWPSSVHCSFLSPQRLCMQGWQSRK
jgi:hypothetical protein